MIKKRWNIKKEKLKEKLLNEQQGFIVGNVLIILPLIFSLIIAILVIVQAKQQRTGEIPSAAVQFVLFRFPYGSVLGSRETAKICLNFFGAI